MLNAVENNEIVLSATQWANVGVDAPDNTIFVVVATIHGLFFVVEMA